MTNTEPDVVQLLKLIDESDFDEVTIEIDGFRLHARKQGEWGAGDSVDRTDHSMPASAPRNASQDAVQPAGDLARCPIEIKAPMLGTFYRASAPGAQPFVQVGDWVTENQTICLIEVMKLFNQVPAGTAGRVLEIVAEEGAMVEHGQTLLILDTAACGK
jgi:acetyl-CoA carboxylase biotin carboxyl carrier protein